jgi:hypothetical protein
VKDGKVAFSLATTDAAGGQISQILGQDGKPPPAPTIDVINAARDVVYTAKLEYG